MEHEKIHKDAIVVDALVPICDDLRVRIQKSETKIFEKIYMPFFKGGGIDVGFVCVASPEIHSLKHYFENICYLYSDLENLKNIKIVKKHKDILSANSENKFSIVMGSQNATFLERDMSLLEGFYKLGLRIVTPCYNKKNEIGDGCLERTDSGLSNLGLEFVESMNKNNMLIDLTHAGKATSMDILEYSKHPVIASHNNPLTMCNNPRNIDDELMKAIADKKGVIGSVPYGSFVSKKSPTIDDFLDRISYTIDLVGIDHVGIGTDFVSYRAQSDYEDAIRLCRQRPDVFGMGPNQPKGFEDATKFPSITEGLVHRGYSKQDIFKVLGGNFLEVFGKVIG